MKSEGPLKFDVPQWRTFLHEWNADIAEITPHIPLSLRDALVTDAVARGTILREPATEEAIRTGEQKLGAALPESLKRFYRASNGMTVLGLDAEHAEMWPVERLSFLRENEPELVNIFGSERISPPDEEYFKYGPDQRIVAYRSEYIRSLVQLSGWVDAAALLLNPKVIDEKGEWEAWYFGVKFPGAFRFRTFEDMMIKVRERTVRGMRRTYFERGR